MYADNNRMKKILTSIALVFVCVSCGETVQETVQILIQNRTESSILITLYPKAEYLSDGCDLYRNSGGGGYVPAKFYLSPNHEGYYEWGEVLFVSSDLEVKPYTLAAKVFDSIHISTANKDKLIKFTHENVTGYLENIFSESSTWDFRIEEDYLPTQFRSNPQKYYSYYFLILEDKLITSNSKE